VAGPKLETNIRLHTHFPCPYPWMVDVYFRSLEDCERIMWTNWNWGPSSLTLSNLDIILDLGREPWSIMKVWEILPGLPLVFWTIQALKSIRNKLRVFSKLESDWE
jgi:hypothetical protein